MLEKLFGESSSHISDWLMLKWAFEHPYLYTVIKVSDPYIMIIVVFIGMSMVKKIFRKNV